MLAELAKMTDSELVEYLQRHSFFRKRFEIEEGIFEVIEVVRYDSSKVGAWAQNGLKTQFGDWGKIYISSSVTDPFERLFIFIHELSHIKNKDYNSTPFIFDVVAFLLPSSGLLLTILLIKGFLGIFIGMALALILFFLINKYFKPQVYRSFEFRADGDAVTVIKDILKGLEIPWSKLLSLFPGNKFRLTDTHPDGASRLKAIYLRAGFNSVTSL